MPGVSAGSVNCTLVRAVHELRSICGPPQPQQASGFLPLARDWPATVAGTVGCKLDCGACCCCCCCCCDHLCCCCGRCCQVLPLPPPLLPLPPFLTASSSSSFMESILVSTDCSYVDNALTDDSTASIRQPNSLLSCAPTFRAAESAYPAMSAREEASVRGVSPISMAPTSVSRPALVVSALHSLRPD